MPHAGETFVPIVASVSLGTGAAIVVGILLAVLTLRFFPLVLKFLLWLWRLQFRTPFLGVWLVLILFLYWDAPLVYPGYVEKMQQILGGYFIMMTLSLVVSFVKPPLATVSVGRFLVLGTVSFLGAAGVFAFLNPLNPESADFTEANVALLVTHALVVAVIEELTFRFAIPFIFQVFGPYVAQGISAVSFGLMHLAVYSHGLAAATAAATPWAFIAAVGPPVLFAAALGFVFGLFNIWWRENGLVVGMGAHFAWNAYTFGFIGAH